MSLSARRGFLLAEALCALALMGLLAAAAMGALRTAQRTLLTVENDSRAQRAAREAMAVTAALLRDAVDPVVWGDTAIEFTARIATSVACDTLSGGLVLPPAGPYARGFSAMAQGLEYGDELQWRDADTVTGNVAWRVERIDSVYAVGAAAACPSGGFVDAVDAGRSRIALRLVSRVMPPVGTPVRVGRRGRLALYAAGGGEWMLGWRRCANGACGTVQPVAGPLSSAARRGFRVTLDSTEIALEVRTRAAGAPPSAPPIVLTQRMVRGDAF
jgi:type II secretory pathway pseudopilin PulG